MIYFDSDYMTGAHPEVLARLSETNSEFTIGYGLDHYCERAEEVILHACGLEKGSVYFFEGGTQTNATVIARLLRSNEGVFATATSHINVHEAGAIEATGHKVLTIGGKDGKLSAEDVRCYLKEYYSDDTHEHIVAPGMVYISFPTELGTLYSRRELENLREVCDEYAIPLYIDGARLAFGLAASPDHLTLADMAQLSDVFYIGGTKCGALFGEAMVTRRPELFRGFRPLIKQRGAMLAKGRLLGVQFLALFSDNLYHKIGRNGVELALKLKENFTTLGVKEFIASPTNQQFFILPNRVIERLRENVSFENWGAPGKESSAVRFVIGWSTTEADIDSATEYLKECLLG